MKIYHNNKKMKIVLEINIFFITNFIIKNFIFFKFFYVNLKNEHKYSRDILF